MHDVYYKSYNYCAGNVLILMQIAFEFSLCSNIVTGVVFAEMERVTECQRPREMQG